MTFEFDAPQEQATNLAVNRSCATCSGDRFVLYATRTDTYNGHSAEVEELAPCPDCNAGVKTQFERPNGSYFRSPDPAKVRERLTR